MFWVMHSLIDRLKSAFILIRNTFTGDVKAVDNYHLLFPCPFMQAYLTHWYKVGPLYPSMAYVTVYRLPGPLLLHRLASALQVKDPHTLPPSNVPELH